MPASRLLTIAARVGTLTVALSIGLAMPVSQPTPARAASGVKVALIVGPMGTTTTSYNRSRADAIASQVIALGGTVTKAYSPYATYSKVRAAVAGANIIVYLGHGNGFPNPYNTKLLADRDDGWGLNTTTTHGDADSWSDGTLVYCGEKALEGLLTSSDGAAQRTYCGAGAIAPAPGFVMVYLGACYTAGGNENGSPAAANSEARLHLAYFSRPILTALHGSGYFAGRAQGVVADLIQHPDRTYGAIWTENEPSGLTGYDMAHALVSGVREWLTRQSGDPYWDYAFAGDPGRTFNGGTATFTAPTGTGDFIAPAIKSRSPASTATGVSAYTKVTVTFSEPVSGTTTHVTLWRGTTKVTVTATYSSTSRTVTLTPSTRLWHGTVYTVKVDKYVRDAANNPFVPTSWTFTTSSS